MIRFGTGPGQAANEPDAIDPTVHAAPALSIGGRVLFVRHARKDGRLVAVLRALDQGHSCVVEAEVYPAGGSQLSRPGPYAFADAHQASAFVTEAVAALMYLGCDIQAE